MFQNKCQSNGKPTGRKADNGPGLGPEQTAVLAACACSHGCQPKAAEGLFSCQRKAASSRRRFPKSGRHFRRRTKPNGQRSSQRLPGLGIKGRMRDSRTMKSACAVSLEVSDRGTFEPLSRRSEFELMRVTSVGMAPRYRMAAVSTNCLQPDTRHPQQTEKTEEATCVASGGSGCRWCSEIAPSPIAAESTAAAESGGSAVSNICGAKCRLRKSFEQKW